MDTRRRGSSGIWSRLPGRFRRGSLAALAMLILGWSAAWSQTPPPARVPGATEEVQPLNPTSQPNGERLREGTELREAQGYFRFVDDRVVFFRKSGDAKYIGLENLNLERIVSEITNNPTQLEWIVVGSITEYRGANYLLVRRAVLSRSTSDFNSPLSLGGQKQ